MKKSIQPIMKFFLIILLALCAVNYAHAQVKPDIRELDSNVLDIDENIKDAGDNSTQNNSVYTTENMRKDATKIIKDKEKDVVDAPILKGGISELHSVVGRSQIVRFDQPVKRISITNPALVGLLPLSTTEFLMDGKQAGETTVIIWGEDDEPVFFNLFVENDNYKIVEEIRKLAPNEDFDIDFVDSGSGSGLQVVLKGKISSSILKTKIEDMTKAYGYTLLNLAETLEPQVLLEVRVVELGKSKSKNRGYEFKQGLFDYLNLAESTALAASKVNLVVNKQTYTDPWFRDVAWELLSKMGALQTSAGDELAIDDFKGSLSGTTFSGGTLGSWKVLPDRNLAYKLNAAESEGLVKTLSEPRVMVINKQQASFNAGSQVPVPAGSDELGNIKYEYKNVGTQISITPTILEESKRILLDISATVSEINSALSTTAGVALNTRDSKTKVEIADNETTVITGLTRKSESKTITKFPGLSNLPVVGKLFNSTTATNDDTELMIFVTASIVKPDLVKGE